jgi:hypothetical protein
MNLENRLRYWQKVLRLQDWDITVKTARMSQLSKPDRLAEVMEDPYHKTAEILILEKVDAPGQDQEASLVHELVHIHLSPGFDGVPEVVLEQTVASFTKALLDLERRKKNG